MGFLFSMLVCGTCQAFETGRWASEKSENGFEGELEIRRDGCCDYTVSRIEFGKRTAGYLDLGCAIEGGEGQVIDKGKRLEIHSHGALGFTLVMHPDYLQVIPNLTVNDLTCRKTGIPEWVRTFKNRTDMEREISGLKWHKVDSFNP